MELFGKLKNKNEPLKEKMFEDYFTEIHSDMGLHIHVRCSFPVQ